MVIVLKGIRKGGTRIWHILISAGMKNRKKKEVPVRYTGVYQPISRTVYSEFFQMFTVGKLCHHVCLTTSKGCGACTCTGQMTGVCAERHVQCASQLYYKTIQSVSLQQDLK
jgi:hypothetical protein